MAERATTGQMSFTLETERRIFQVSELNRAVQRLFESDFRGIWVMGEISGCRAATSGHLYFSLKDAQSQVKCALFKGTARFLKFRPQDGLSVIARGSLEVYETRGEYQLIVELLEPQGAGALQLAFDQLKKKLAAEGLFEQARKRPLPRLPWRIGIITSPAGAVISDMLHVLERRLPGVHIRLYPAQVQGEGSMVQLCSGLRFFSESKWADVVILARGGGSLEDLWSFNEEALARAIAACKVPVVSAVGHETDFTIADFAADLRAPTPSAAAEVIVPTRVSLLDQIAGCRAKILQAVRYRLLLCTRDLHERGAGRAAMLMHRAIGRRAQRLDDFDSQLRQRQRLTLDRHSKALDALTKSLQANDLRLRFARIRHAQELLDAEILKIMQGRLWQARRQHELLDMHLRQLSPLSVLGRGYAIVENAGGRVLRSSTEASAGERLRILLHRGEVDASVLETRLTEPRQ
jgi:exodeoxyribonuclease VII large subunit